jgi:hypothetical protein
VHRSARELLGVEGVWLQVPHVPMHRMTHTIVIVAVIALIRVHCGALELLGVISLHIPMHRLTQAVVIVVVIAVVVTFSHHLHLSELMQRGVRIWHG